MCRGDQALGMVSAAPVAIVTGSNRNPGIGYEIVRGLARRMPPETTVILTARVPELGEKAAEDLRSEGLNVIFHQLELTNANSVAALRTFVDSKFGGLDVLVNNAGLAFKLQDTTPFPEQARQSVDANYHGTKRMVESFRGAMRPGGRMIGVSSSSGQLGSSWSEALKARLLAEDLSVDQLDAIAEEFVSAAASGNHTEQGFPNSAYGTSKALMNQLHRVIARDIEPSSTLVATLCPGLCRTYMATGRGTLMSNVLWVASFFVGSSAAGGADTPLWLCCDISDEERATCHGKFLKSRAVCSF